jgi:hypothetical protein
VREVEAKREALGQEVEHKGNELLALEAQVGYCITPAFLRQSTSIGGRCATYRGSIIYIFISNSIFVSSF